jgi:hypothetical protein
MVTSSTANWDRVRTIRTRSELAHLTTVRSIFKRYESIKLELDQVDPDVQIGWENDINRLYNACGCGEGKFFVFLGFVLFILQSGYNHTLSITWKNAGIAFLYCLAGAALGKLIGKYRAYLKLRKKIADQLMHLAVV